MKILLINKYLYPRGGAETYVFALGKHLQERGHQVEYFGMEHEHRIAGNSIQAYVRHIDYHSSGILGKLRSGLSAIYSREARRKLRLVLEDFQPDVCHLNNFHYQLTPSILLEIRDWRRRTGRTCKILYTAHDSQLVCPNHLMRNPITNENCSRCLTGTFLHCVKGRCIHGSYLRSILGALEGWYWNRRKVYGHLDVIISPSRFLARQLSVNPLLQDKIVFLPNFVVRGYHHPAGEKEDYVLYFGRYSKEKGIETLLCAIDALPWIPFVFAGAGPLKGEVGKRKNITDRGFLSGQELWETIEKARFSVVPSVCFENCPYSVLESQLLGTPVLGAETGGIPELICPGETGELFESGNKKQLVQKIRSLWQDTDRLRQYSENCKTARVFTPQQYCEILEKHYQ